MRNLYFYLYFINMSDSQTLENTINRCFFGPSVDIFVIFLICLVSNPLYICVCLNIYLSTLKNHTINICSHKILRILQSY